MPADTRVSAMPDRMPHSGGVTRKVSIGQLDALMCAFLYALKEAQVPARFEIKDEHGVGQLATDAGPDIDLEPPDADRTVSRRHARIRRVNDGFEVEDLGSVNRTELRGQALAPGRA